MMAPDKLIAYIEDYYHIPVGSVLQIDKHKTIVKARRVIIYMLRTLYKYSYPEIGRILNRDHSSIYYAFKVFHKQRNSDKFLDLDVRTISYELCKGYVNRPDEDKV